jgi:Spy/CpxP family protein refolding chaperone
MIRKATIAAAVLGLTATQPLMAQTTPSGMGHPHMMVMGGGMAGMHGGGLMMLLRSANLTPAQQSQVQQIVASAQPQMKALHAQMEALHQQIADRLLSPGQVSAADVRPLVHKMTAVEAQLTESMTTTAIAIRNVLTAEQLAQLTKLHKKLQSLHSQIRGLLGSGTDMQDSAD